jgi:hypothetical protein
MPALAPRTFQRHVQELLRRRVIGRKLPKRQTMAHLALRRLQEFGVIRCERMIERFAVSVRGLSPRRRCPAHDASPSPLNAISTQ